MIHLYMQIVEVEFQITVASFSNVKLSKTFLENSSNFFAHQNFFDWITFLKQNIYILIQVYF